VNAPENFNSSYVKIPIMFRPLHSLISSNTVYCDVIKKDVYLRSHSIPDLNFVSLPSGLRYRDKKLGEGKSVERGDIVNVQFTGRLSTGREIETTLGRPGSLLTIVAGGSDAVPAVSEGIIGMVEYGSREILAPPRMHYPSKYANDIMIYDVMVRTIVRKSYELH
jgi:FKBP-type peptidyl-prolyl cis-trans isomerase